MDFEVEGDDTDSYDYDYGHDNTHNKKVVPKKSSTSFFGGDSRADEESAYDFSYHNEAPIKKKYEPFSPVVHSYDAKPAKGGGHQVVAAPAVSAMERAQSMLDRYSGKSTSAPPSNFRNQKIRTFNEDEMSMSSSDEEPSEFEMSESEDSPVKKKGSAKNAKNAKHAKKGKDINALDSKATVVVSMGAAEDEEYLSEEGSPVIPPPVKQISRFSNMGTEEDSRDDSRDDNEYSNDQFDQDDNGTYEESAEEVGESTRMSQTVDTEVSAQAEDSHLNHSDSTRSRSDSDSTRPSSPDPSHSRSHDMSKSFSPGFENNTSYSRIGYGNEVDESVEDDDPEMSGSSKLKVFSFAELRSWEDAEKENQSHNAGAGAHAELAAKSADALSKAILDMSSHIITAPSSHKPVPTIAEVKATAKAASKVAEVAKMAPTLSHSPPRVPHAAAPVIASVPVAVRTSYAPVTASQHVPAPAHVVTAPALHAAAVQPTVYAAPQPLPGQHPYPYAAAPAPAPAYPPPQYYAAPPADPNSAPGSVPTATGPPYSPYYPYPYAYPPPPPAYGFYPYSPHMPPMHPPPHPAAPHPIAGGPTSPDLSAWAYPRRSFESWDPRWSREASMYPPNYSSIDPRARLSGSYGGVGSSRENLAQESLVLDLLSELRKSKEEADWAKQKLAETIVRLGAADLSSSRENHPSRHTDHTFTKTTKHVHHADHLAPKTTVSPERQQQVRSAMRFPAVTAHASARPETNLEDSGEMAEVYSDSEGPNNDSVDYYSDDFEGDSPTKTHSSTSATHTQSKQPPKPQAAKHAQTKQPHSTSSHKDATTAAAPQAHAQVRELSAEQVGAQETASSLLRDRERVMNPMKESLAHSLLASQELFKSQLESLRARISATNDYTNIMQQRVNNQWDELNGRPASSGNLSDILSGTVGGSGDQQQDLARTSFSSTPSLAQIQSEFAEKRVRSTEKLFDLLVQIYPNMTVAEAKRLAAKF